MTRAQEKDARKAKAIAKAEALKNTAEAGQALITNNEQEFFRLFPVCEVSLKFICVLGGKNFECNLFSAASIGAVVRKKDDLAKLVIKRMITEGVDLRTYRIEEHSLTMLMIAAMNCGREVVEIVLPRSDPAATTINGATALDLAQEMEATENAELIQAYILSGGEAKIIGDDIPIPPPPPGPRKRSSLR